MRLKDQPQKPLELEKFPKSERFRLARRLEDTVFEFYHLLMKATRSTKRKQTILLNADFSLQTLQLYLRISHDRHLTTDKQYQYASKKLHKITPTEILECKMS